MKILDLINSERNLTGFSDKEIYHLCQEYGRGIKVLRRIFAVLLVEVFRRNLHRKYGFESIYEFGAKVGGMNSLLIGQILCLARAVQDKPYLRRAFRREGWSKLRVVANIATIETDKFWAEKVDSLSKPALEVFVKEWKQGRISSLSSQQLSFPENPDNNANSLLTKPESEVVQNLGERILYSVIWKNRIVKIRFNVTEETEFKFRLFKQKLGKKRKMAVTSGETLMELLFIAGMAGE